MLIFILVIIGLSLLIFGHEAGHFVMAKLFGLNVDEFGFGFPPRIIAKKIGETEYSFNWLPFGGFVKIKGENDHMQREFSSGLNDDEKKHNFAYQPAWKRSIIVLAGVIVNFLLGWLLLAGILMVGTPKALVITDVQANSPAAMVGLATGDVVRGFNKSDDFIDFINSHRGQSIQVEIDRSGKTVDFSVTPRLNPAPNEGALGVVLADAGEPKHPFFEAIGFGFKDALIISGMTFMAFYDLIKNLFLHGSLLAGVVGPVGIFSVAEQTGSIGLIYLVQLVSLISLNLAVVNLIPFPALDGGRFFMIIVEKIKGSPISRKTENWINSLGFAFLIVLMVLITIRDVAHWF